MHKGSSLLLNFEMLFAMWAFQLYVDKQVSKRDSLMVSQLACHAADPGSNPARGDDFFN